MAEHSYNIAKSRGNLSKGGYRITGNGKVLVGLNIKSLDAGKL